MDKEIAYIGKRGQLGAFNTLLPDLCDEVKLHDYLRIDLTTFEELYALIESEVRRKNTRMR